MFACGGTMYVGDGQRKPRKGVRSMAVLRAPIIAMMGGILMDFQSIVSAISTVGFPAIVCIILIYINWKQQERHQNEMQTMTEAINNNTVALKELITYIKKEETE